MLQHPVQVVVGKIHLILLDAVKVVLVKEGLCARAQQTRAFIGFRCRSVLPLLDPAARAQRLGLLLVRQLRIGYSGSAPLIALRALARFSLIAVLGSVA